MIRSPPRSTRTHTLLPSTTLFHSLIGMLRPIVVPLFRINKPAQAGQVLADLALGRIEPPAGRLYASLVKRRLTWTETSDLAQPDDRTAEHTSELQSLMRITYDVLCPDKKNIQTKYEDQFLHH